MWTIIAYVVLGWIILSIVFVVGMWLGATFTKNKYADEEIQRIKETCHCAGIDFDNVNMITQTTCYVEDKQ